MRPWKILPCEEGNELAEELADLAVECRANVNSIKEPN